MMNERIKQLYEQAHERKPTMRTSPVTWQPVPALGHDGVPMYSNEFNPDMFAELIVKECKDLLFESSENNRLPIAVDDMIHIIDTHFGVDQGHPEEACDDEECYDVNPDW